MELSENVSRLRPSATIAVSSLARRLAAEGRDIVNLSAGEPDFDTPPFVSERAISGIREGRTRYTPAAGLPELRRAITEALNQDFGTEVHPEGVVVSCGAKHAIFNACFSLFGPGDEVLIAAPYWTSYPEIVTLARAEPRFVRGDAERDLRVSAGDLEAAHTPRTRGLILATPGNPTGTVYSHDELREIVEWARTRGVWFVSDEIYREIYFDGEGRAPGILDLDDGSLEGLVLVDGLSKSHAMTGWRIGFSVTTPELARTIAALQSHTTSNPATPSQVAALAAFQDRDESREAVRGMLSAFRRRRDLVVRLMDELLPDLPYLYPRGAFYLFFRVDGAFGDEPVDAGTFCTWLLEETGVALVPGGAFGDDRYARLSYAASESVLEEGLRRMAAAVGERRAVLATG